MNTWIDNTINTIKAGFMSTMQAGGKLSSKGRKSQKVAPKPATKPAPSIKVLANYKKYLKK